MSALEHVGKQDLLKFYEQKISSHGLDRRKLSIQIYSSQHALALQAAESQSEGTGSVTTTLECSKSGSLPDGGDLSSLPKPKGARIQDIKTFKLSQSLYGVPTGLTAYLAP